MKVGAMGVADAGFLSTVYFGEDGAIMVHSELSVRISFGGAQTAALSTITLGKLVLGEGQTDPLDSTGQNVFLATPTILQNTRPGHE